MAANQAITPARRLYFAAQLAYLDPAHLDQHRKLFLSRFEDLISVVSGQEGKAALHQCAIAAAKTDWWESMRAARRLIDYEAGLMGPAATWQKNFAESDELTSDDGDLLSAREGTC
jgi:flagellar protein FlbT